MPRFGGYEGYEGAEAQEERPTQAWTPVYGSRPKAGEEEGQSGGNGYPVNEHSENQGTSGGGEDGGSGGGYAARPQQEYPSVARRNDVHRTKRWKGMIGLDTDDYVKSWEYQQRYGSSYDTRVVLDDGGGSV